MAWLILIEVSNIYSEKVEQTAGQKNEKVWFEKKQTMKTFKIRRMEGIGKVVVDIRLL